MRNSSIDQDRKPHHHRFPISTGFVVGVMFVLFTMIHGIQLTYTICSVQVFVTAIWYRCPVCIAVELVAFGSRFPPL
jgi:hypothetical protein